jgi:catalase
MSERKKPTTTTGCPVADDRNATTAGLCGPQLLAC